MSRPVTYETAESAKAIAVKIQIEKDCMDESLIGLLEIYLDEQIATGVVDEDANVTLLKLYTIYPSHAQNQALRTAQVLTKGLMTLPSSFFLGATYLVSDALRKTKEISELLQAGQYLQTCRFPEFWQLELTSAKKITGFEAAIRKYALDVIGRSHDVVSVAFVSQQLKLGNKEVEGLASELGWTLRGTDFVVKPNADNQMRPKKFKEDITFTDLLDTINILSR